MKYISLPSVPSGGKEVRACVRPYVQSESPFVWPAREKGCCVNKSSAAIGRFLSVLLTGQRQLDASHALDAFGEVFVVRENESLRYWCVTVMQLSFVVATMAEEAINITPCCR